MATCKTFDSIQEAEDYLNSITLPSDWYLLGRRGFVSFVSPETVSAGGANGITLQLAESETELTTILNALSGSNTLIDVIVLGAYYVVIANSSVSAATYSVTTYESATDLATGTGLEVISLLDDSTANSSGQAQTTQPLGNLFPNDELVSFGGTYTLIKQVPTTLLVRSKGGYYTTIQTL